MLQNSLASLPEDYDRAVATRAAYINWRMRDVPAIYYVLIPVSFDAAVLWKAEKKVRKQLVIDLELLASKWRQIGPPCATLNLDTLNAVELIQFGCEISIPHGMEAQPRRPITLPADPATGNDHVENDGNEDKAAKLIAARHAERQRQIDAANAKLESDTKDAK